VQKPCTCKLKPFPVITKITKGYATIFLAVLMTYSKTVQIGSTLTHHADTAASNLVDQAGMETETKPKSLLIHSNSRDANMCSTSY